MFFEPGFEPRRNWLLSAIEFLIVEHIEPDAVGSHVPGAVGRQYRRRQSDCELVVPLAAKLVRLRQDLRPGRHRGAPEEI